MNDPNSYLGPGTGYRVSEARRQELSAIRDVLDRGEILRAEALHAPGEARRIAYRGMGTCGTGGQIRARWWWG